jgi:hypothetical protein
MTEMAGRRRGARGGFLTKKKEEGDGGGGVRRDRGEARVWRRSRGGDFKGGKRARWWCSGGEGGPAHVACVISMGKTTTTEKKRSEGVRAAWEMGLAGLLLRLGFSGKQEK